LITPDSSTVPHSQSKIEDRADETHRLGKICATHARSRDSITNAAKAGFDLIFHASYIDVKPSNTASRTISS